MTIDYGEDLIRVWNQLIAIMVSGQIRPHYGRARGGYLRFTEERLKQAHRLLAWMRENHFSPLSYLCGAFGSHAWVYAPRLEKLQEPRYRRAYEQGCIWADRVRLLLTLPSERRGQSVGCR